MARNKPKTRLVRRMREEEKALINLRTEAADKKCGNLKSVEKTLPSLVSKKLDGIISSEKDGSLKRFCDSLSDRTIRGPSYGVLERRVNDAKTLTPDEDILKTLDDSIEEWDEDEPIPSLEEITEDDMQRIKKGMVNGRLYNLGFHLIKEMFYHIKTVTCSTIGNDSKIIQRFKCPLCPKSYAYTKSPVYDHIESAHTMSLITCDHCKTVLTSRKSCKVHQCEAILKMNERNSNDSSSKSDGSSSKTFKETNANFVPGAEKGAASEIVVESPFIDLTVDEVTDETSDAKDEEDGVIDDSFKRYSGSLFDCQVSANSLSLMKRRRILANNLTPDAEIFKGLNGVDEWEINEPIPPIEKITRSDIKRLKKGMMNGKLYNIAFGVITRMFHDFKRVNRKKVWWDSRQCHGRFKCPLCSKSYDKIQRVYPHIESLHTMSLLICIHCKTLITGESRQKPHRCDDKISKPKKAHKLVQNSGWSESTDASKNPSNTFERSFGRLDDCTVHSSVYKILDRRQENVKTIKVDKGVFTGLTDIREWNVAKPIPSTEKLTELDIKRIKKGMANGQLYNLGVNHLEKIFPRFSRDSSNGGRNLSRFKCPLCSLGGQTRNKLVHHIEREHTMSLVLCLKCKTLLPLEESWKTHRCNGESMEVSDGESEGDFDRLDECLKRVEEGL